jgi:kynurenine formamidase
VARSDDPTTQSDPTRRPQIVADVATGNIDVRVFSRAQRGGVYDLCSGYFTGMPLSTGHPPFQVVTFRTPWGERNQRDLAFLDDNPYNFGFISELVMGTMHSGTHIDARGHITNGPDNRFFGDFSANEKLGDFGLLEMDATELKPIFSPGYLLDIPALTERINLDANEPIGPDELEAARQAEEIEISPGAAIMVRTGKMHFWPDAQAMSAVDDAGVNLAGGHWLADRRPVVVGADTPAFEVAPSGVAGDPQPVHRFMLPELGIPIMEWARLEELSRDKVYEFLFVCVPLPIRGATGSLVRPLAIV